MGPRAPAVSEFSLSETGTPLAVVRYLVIFYSLARKRSVVGQGNAALGEEARHVRAPELLCEVLGVQASMVARVAVRASVDELLDQLELTLERRTHEHRVPCSVAAVRICPALQEQLDRLHAPRVGRQHQR